ncbi:MAG: IscS subfamily cysteine desulfurase [Candidatus Binatia bacterium]
MARPIYMDHHATTPVDPRVLEMMLPFFGQEFGNAASRSHSFGWRAENAVEDAREKVARLIGARGKEIVFTSGATESNNLAIRGVVEFQRDKGDHVVTCTTEHNAVLDPLRSLEKRGLVHVTRLPVDREGLVDPDAVAKAIGPRTVLVSIMLANNEIGTIQPFAEVGRVAKDKGVLFHSDATQAVGKIPVDVASAGIDLLSLSAHKLYGPKGAGALYVRSREPRVRLAAQMDGGGHERGLRSGTLNVPGIVGLGRACELAAAEMETEGARLRILRDRLRERILAEVDETTVNGPDDAHRLSGNLNLAFGYVEAESLLMGLADDVALSSGSACTSATLEASHVLKAISVPDDLAHGSIRFGLGRWNTVEEVDTVAARVTAEVSRLRALSPMYGVRRAQNT